MNYTIVEDAQQLDFTQVMALLKQTYWADKRSAEQVRISMENSRCYGVVLEDGRLVGFARVISDFATPYYLCDVIIDPDYRQAGLGKALVSHVVSRFAGLRGILLTRDAHGLYEQYGFMPGDGRAMIRNPG